MKKILFLLLSCCLVSTAIAANTPCSGKKMALSLVPQTVSFCVMMGY